MTADYEHPKTSHLYKAHLVYTTDLPDGLDVVPSVPGNSPLAPSPSCRQLTYSSGMLCSFEHQLAVPLAPEVGAAPIPPPATSSITLGLQCELQLSVTVSSPEQLSFAGRAAPSPCPVVEAQTFAYADRREAGVPIARGNYLHDAYGGPSAGSAPAVQGGTYTVTYYATLFLTTEQLPALPPECRWDGGTLSGNVFCELTASVVLP